MRAIDGAASPFDMFFVDRKVVNKRWKEMLFKTLKQFLSLMSPFIISFNLRPFNNSYQS